MPLVRSTLAACDLMLKMMAKSISSAMVSSEATLALRKNFSVMVGTSLSRRFLARTLPAMESKAMPLYLEQSDFSPLFFYRETITAS